MIAHPRREDYPPPAHRVPGHRRPGPKPPRYAVDPASAYLGPLAKLIAEAVAAERRRKKWKGQTIVCKATNRPRYYRYGAPPEL